jgi:anti-sigma-K factor RskA
MSAEELELDDLLGAYALDAVSDEERRAVEQYLMIDPRARQEVAEHREVATMLAWSGMSAPDGLWDRIAAQIDTHDAPSPTGQLASVMGHGSLGAPPRRESVAGTAAPSGSSSSSSSSSGNPTVSSIDDARRRRAAKGGWRTAGSWVAASAAAAIVAIVAVTVIGGEETTESPLAAAVSDARADSDSVVATLVNADGVVGAEVVIDQDGHGYVIGQELPTLPSGQTYQLWGVIGEQVISLGVLGTNPQIEPFSAGGEEVSQVVVTIEPAGGVISNGNPDGAYAGTLG